MKKTLLTIVALAFLLITIGSSAQTPINSDWWVPNRIVNTIVSDDNYTYIGGEFTYIGPNTGKGVTIDPSTGIAATDMPLVNGSVNIAVPDGNGGWYIGGSFTSVEGVDRNHLAHIKPDKTVNLEWNPNMSIGEYPDIHEVRVIAISGNNIYVGGQFTSIGGKARTNLAKLNNTNGDADETWNPGANNKVWTIAISGDDIYVGGEFTNIGGQSRNRIAKLNNTNGDADETWNPGANNKVLTIAISGDDIYVGGDFTSIGGQSRNRIAKLNNTNGDADETWNPSANSFVWSIALAGENIYAGGNFTSIGGEPRNYIAKLNNTDGTADPNWNPNANQSVMIIAISGDDIYLGGNFSSIGGQTRNRIARFHNSDGTLDEAWNPNASSYVLTIALSGDDIYVGGSFTSIGGQTRNYIAKLNNTNGAADVAWNPNSNSVVRAIAISGDDIYVGGQFTIIGGQTRNYIAKLNNTDGTADLNWNPNANTIVWSIAISGDDIYVGGQFTIIGGQTRKYIAKLNNTDGAADATWNPNASGPVNTIAIYGDDIYVGGDFTSIGGQSRNRIAKLNNTDGAADATWNPNASGPVNTIAIYGDDIYVGGGFTSIGGQTRNRIAKLNNTNGNPDASWDPNINSTVRLIYISNDNIFAGGEFTSVGGKAQQNFAVFDLSYFFISGTLSPFTTTAGTVSDAQTFTLSGSNLIADATVTAPIHFEVSTDGTTYSQSITVAQTDGVITDQIIYVRIAASASGGDHSGNITVASTDTPIQNIAVSGTVTPTYQINFDANNGEGGEVQTVVHGDFPTPPAVTRDGYNFLSWSPDIVEATEDATYTAQWEIIEYTVTYNLEGGDNHEDNPAEFTIEDLTIALEDANKTAYTFLGWFDNAELAGEAVTQISTIGDKELWASFEAIEYTITYHTDGGAHANPATFTVEDLDITLVDATKYGYNFLGWFGNAELTGDAVTHITGIGDVELWASFEAIEYTITYHADGGTHANPATFTIEDLNITLADATKNGYNFLGWFDNAELTGEAVTQITEIGDVELWAKFEAIIYNITYHADGGTHANPATFTIEDLNVTLLTASKAGYTFLGWFCNAELTGDAVTHITGIGNVELWAKFEAIVYNINYHADGGTHANPATFTIEDLEVTLAEASKDGYNFLGWFDNAELTGEAVTQITEIRNVELWAGFEVIEYIITASTGDNGGISPVGNVVVEHGNSQSFVITPNEGYVIAILSVDGNQINLENDENWDAETLTYEFVSVTSNHTVHVEFDTASATTFTQAVKPRAYPNPFSNHISISDAEGNERVVITNIAGQRVVDIFLNGNTTISTSTLKSGVYILSITNSKGDTFVSRIVKDKK